MADWDAAFTVKGIKLEALVAEATWWQLQVDKVWEVPLIHVASDLELAASNAYIALKIKLAGTQQPLRFKAATTKRESKGNEIGACGFERVAGSRIIPRLARTQGRPSCPASAGRSFFGARQRSRGADPGRNGRHQSDARRCRCLLQGRGALLRLQSTTADGRHW